MAAQLWAATAIFSLQIDTRQLLEERSIIVFVLEYVLQRSHLRSIRPLMDKTVVRKFKLGEEPTDFAYWQSRPMEERLRTLETIRREYHQWRYGAEPEFQRVCRVVKRA